jgi:hypothetical protein
MGFVQTELTMESTEDTEGGMVGSNSRGLLRTLSQDAKAAPAAQMGRRRRAIPTLGNEARYRAAVRLCDRSRI